MTTIFRPAVRIVCLDARDRVLLLRWQDPANGSFLWEPPGGGIEAGETPFETARRELVEETGLDPSSIVDAPIVVDRDIVWNGKHFAGPESFFLARFPALDAPPLTRAGLLPDEQQNLRGTAWATHAELLNWPEALEPPSLLAEIRRLAPSF